MKYLWQLVLVVLGGMLAFGGGKFLWGHHLSPTDAGLGGALAQPKIDLLLMGSSHTRKSYDVRMLETATGIHNLYLLEGRGMDLSTMSLLLDYLITKPKTRPRYVVIEAYGLMLAREPDIQEPRLYTDAPPALKVRILQAYLRDRPLQTGVPDLFDLMFNRGNDEIVAFPFFRWATRKSSYKGGRLDFYFAGMTPAEFRELKPISHGITPNKQQVTALRHLMDLADRNGISMIFVDTPMPRPVTANAQAQQLKCDFRKEVASRGYRYVDGDRIFPNDEPELFSDDNHLSSKGREVFQPIILKELLPWIGRSGRASQEAQP